MHLLLYAGTCAHICTYVHTFSVHTRIRAIHVTYVRRMVRSRTHASDRTKYEQTSFSICFRLFEKWRTQSAVCAVLAFPGMPQNLCIKKKKNKNHCATKSVTFSSFLYFRILTRDRINESHYRRCTNSKNTILY